MNRHWMKINVFEVLCRRSHLWERSNCYRMELPYGRDIHMLNGQDKRLYGDYDRLMLTFNECKKPRFS